MNHFRISKYDPRFRVDGIYTRDEWTDYSDIGKSFDGVPLTAEDYEKIEANYLGFFQHLMEVLSIQTCHLSQVENYDSNWQDDALLSSGNAVIFLRDCLRNRSWGRLEHPTLTVYTGFDYYLHILCPLSYEDLCRLAQPLCLFVEKWGLQLVEGHPADESKRLSKEIRCYNLLDSLGIPYQRIDHEPAMTMEACSEIDQVLDAAICKNLLLCNRQCTVFYLLMIAGDKHFKTSTFSKQIGSSRLSFASGDYMEQFLDITPGSLSVLGLMNDKEHRVELLIDEDILKDEFFGCHPCINTSSLRLKTKDLMEKILPAVKHEARIVTLANE